MGTITAYPTEGLVTIVLETCYKCGVPFGLEKGYLAQRLKDHSLEFYCPNGHSQHYIGETEAEKLKRQLQWKKDEVAALRADRDQIEASRRAYKGQATKLRNRTIAGQCPICGQSLHDLGRHIRRVHPDETPEAEA